MIARLALVTGALALVAGALGTEPAATAQEAAAQSSMNHAAVVVDTGDGAVRKMCLAFPEAEISGIEALRRVDTRPSRFETFSGKGSGVCMLCGVGCESGDCFCNPDKYWAYHRAGPGEPQYKVSALGASSTVVRNGDVEAWRWGSGAAPAKTTVSEVCGIEEPPARTTSATTTPTETTTTTEASQPPTSTTPTPTPTSPPTPTPAAPTPGATGTPTTTPPPGPAVTEASPTEVPVGDESDREAAAPAGAEVKRSLGAEAGAPAETSETSTRGQIASLAAFTVLLGGLLAWRSRLRRAKVRRVRPVR